MSSQAASEVASTVQSAHIRMHPDPELDIAPATAAEKKEVLTLKDTKYAFDALRGEQEEDIPYSVLRPAPRKQNLPPLPDLRFEQSYLQSISAADTWWKIVMITTRDQIIMPLAQGIIYNLILCGWQQWNRNARLHGNTVGARVRRWWYGVNNWAIPPPSNSRGGYFRR